MIMVYISSYQCAFDDHYLLNIILREHHPRSGESNKMIITGTWKQSHLASLVRWGVTSAMVGLFQPTSPHPRSSASTNTMFGRLSAACLLPVNTSSRMDLTSLIIFMFGQPPLPRNPGLSCASSRCPAKRMHNHTGLHLIGFPQLFV